MIVSKDTFDETLKKLFDYKVLSFDTETTGLSPYKGDRLFSIIIGTSEREAYYFNFNVMPDIPKEYILSPSHLKKLGTLFAKEDILWFGHNAKFDMHFLAKEGIEIAGKIHCTMVTARLVYNVHDSYSLASCAERIGYKKDDAVEEYIAKHHLWDWVVIPGVKKRDKKKYYNKVPFDIIAPYGCTDGTVAYALGMWQLKELERLSGPSGVREEGCTVPPVMNVYENECELIKVVFKIERDGMPVDVPFCKASIEHNNAIAEKLKDKLEKILGHKYTDGEKCNCKLLEADRDKWKKSDNGKWSFKKDIIKFFTCPEAEIVRKLRQAKYNVIFFSQCLWFMDSNGVLHPNLDSAGADTGRFSSKEPNHQNMKNEEKVTEDDPTFPWRARKSVVPPSPEYRIACFDYSAQEFYLAAVYGRQTDLIEKIKAGMDPHLATAYTMGLTNEKDSKAKQAKERTNGKTLNFALIYGARAKKIALMLKCSVEEAERLLGLYFSKVNGIASFLDICKKKAESRGFILNWAGRILYYPYRYNKKKKGMYATDYKAPNGCIQGGAADITKIAMVRVGKLLEGKESRMFLSLHDEIDLFIHRDEEYLLPKIKEIMENVYPRDVLGMKTTMAIGDTNWADCVEV